MLRVIIKNVTIYMIWMIMGLVLLPPVSSAEPKAIDDLIVSDSTFHSVTLTWTSPGKATSYDARYSTSILDIDSWDLACQVLGEPAPEESGTSQSMTFSGLSPNTTYYFAIKSCDGDTNCSTLSNIPDITTDNDDFIRYIIYENAEDGTIKRWSKPVWPPEITIKNIFDEKRQSYVIELQGYGTSSKYYLHLEDGNTWNINTCQFEDIVVKWSMSYSEDFFVYFNVKTDSRKVENMVYLLLEAFIEYLDPNVGGDNEGDKELRDRLIDEKPAYCKRGLYIYHFLDPEAKNGEWHTFVRDLQADLEDIYPLDKILNVIEFHIAGSGRMDDIMFGMAKNTGTDTTQPTSPANLTAEAISSSQINLMWDASTDDGAVTDYRINRDGVEIGMSTTTSYTDKGLMTSTTYTYEVAAYDEAGNLSNNSIAVSEETIEATSEPPPDDEGIQEKEQGTKEIECFIMTSVF